MAEFQRQVRGADVKERLSGRPMGGGLTSGWHSPLGFKPEGLNYLEI
jgi:hypothetical protein